MVGIEWILDNDASNAAVLVASEAHAITLAIEGLLGVVFTIATLTDEAVDTGEVISFDFCKLLLFSIVIVNCLQFFFKLLIDILFQLESPRCESDPPAKLNGKTAFLCYSMVDSLWLTILDTLSLILARYFSCISYSSNL